MAATCSASSWRLEESLIERDSPRQPARRIEARVDVECKASPRAILAARARSRAAAFNRNHVPDCTADENLECPGGRGLALIKAYMTRVEYNKRGNCVTMEKIRTSDATLTRPYCRPCEAGDSTPE